MEQGFVLQPTYRIEAGRPVVLIYGRLESGASFLIRDDRETPHFHVRRSDATRARALGAAITEEDPPRHTMSGEDVVRVSVAIPGDAPPLRDRLREAGVPCYEADVRFAYRYLIDRGIRSSVEIEGAPRAAPSKRDRSAASKAGRPAGPGVDLVFDNPAVRPGDFKLEPRVLSFDIETDMRAEHVLSISLAGCGAEEVLLLTPAGYSCPAGAIPVATERELLKAFVRRVQELDPDFLTGWNVVDFDVTVLARLARRLGVGLFLGREYEGPRFRPATWRQGSSSATIPGRLLLDGIELLRGAFVRLESYSLGEAARAILGKEKVIGGRDRAREILAAFRDDRERFVAYNLTDSKLVLEILDRLRLIDLTIERSRLTGMPPDRVAASIASFDFLYLSELHRRRIVAPTVEPGSSAEVVTLGGHVLDSRPGLHRNVLLLDFQSLYPSIIRTFQIDPLGLLPESAAGEQDAIRAPNGARFRRAPGILPGLLDDLFPRRAAARAAGDAVASQAIKILMNSFYGVLGTPACRFASPSLANAITGFGREILLWSKARIEAWGHEVLYGDTDSLFVLSGVEDAAGARELGASLARRLTADLAEHIATGWRIESRLELRFEKLYLKLFLPPLRGGTTGARKRYAGLLSRGEETVVDFTGMEIVRRDWTELAHQVQRELYTRLFADQPVDSYLRERVRDVRAGRCDDLLVYRKGLRKGLEAYTASTPPHVSAARKMGGGPGRLIEYLMTRNGPEPLHERKSPLDHEHYVQKQIRPVAEPVLAWLGLEFDRVVGDDQQMTLF